MNQRFLLCIFAVVTVLAAACETQTVRQYPPPPPPPPPVAQAPSMGLADIKALAKAGLSDDVIIGKIQDSHSIYHLSSAEVVDLKDAGVGPKVIDFIMNTSQASAPTAVADGSVPPVPIAEAVVAAPGPQYVWIGGYWDWDGGGHWVWLAGRWSIPPYPHAIWVAGYWGHRRHHWIWVSAHWR